MPVFFRAIAYGTLFVGFLFIYLPARILSWVGIARPEAMAWPQIAGIIITSAGAAVALWCVVSFIWIGRGTPAPFDPPRKLLIRGPYRFVRNPMYIGAGLALAGAALFFASVSLLVYGALFVFAAHFIVVFYEEPTLRRSFGAEYDAYCRQVRRWVPGMGARR